MCPLAAWASWLCGGEYIHRDASVVAQAGAS